MDLELKDFVKEVLADIAIAVKESQHELANVASISPSYECGSQSNDVKWAEKIFSKVSTVEFDVAVASYTTESKAGEKSAGVTVLGLFSAGAGGKHVQSNMYDSQNISRIKFSIPIAFAPDRTLNLTRFCEKNQ